MNELLRTTVAGAAGAVVATAVLAGAPAIADELKAKKITSAMIKNGTIKTNDLSPQVRGSLVKADTALQGIASGSVTTAKLADGSVTTTKLTDDVVTRSKIGAAAVGTEELDNFAVTGQNLAGDSVTGQSVDDYSLHVQDIARSAAIVITDLPSVSTGNCVTSVPIGGGGNLDNAIILVEAAVGVSGAIQLHGRQTAPGASTFEIVACNLGGTFDPPSASYLTAVINTV